MRPLARIALTLAALGLAVGAAVLVGKLAFVREDPAYEEIMPTFRAPEELARPSLPAFRFTHPRLPAPTPADLAVLRARNPGFLRGHRDRAAKGSGDLYSATLTAFVEPGSVDLTALHARLMAQEFGYRGNEGFPISLGYDWLHDQWSEAQRTQLAAHLLKGCRETIDVIRNERLSPYNVYLYNRPLQSLMACAVALYGDLPEADGVMAFTEDLWRNRVLPVWRQVMGVNGGWHEGKEYVGIGIGGAVWFLPAVWRQATGEDLFRTEPGLRGFLDFLVYRTRPDGTHFRWGDGAFFDRGIPDRVPLALEYRHPAALNLGGRPRPWEPAGWPWGRLADPDLYDPEAVKRLPLTAYFDGIGLIVARSDWGPDATYVTFKAGDNYWSHSHLDQGAFTIDKGGALAIDSGLYGPRYGSDHHLNYDYQAIAHNVVTLTDPADTEPLPTKTEPKSFANDGGQRRVGSGWGLDPAPLDLAEWQSKRVTYHTGQLERVAITDDAVVVVADVTPAYTNELSGRGTFANRTRRVDRLRRTFVYDRVADAIIVFDQVTATKPAFTKRWLLHTIEEPQATAAGFEVRVAPEPRPGHAGGRLEAHVLLPREARVARIGGPGYEWWVDGKNYDEGGAVAARQRERPALETGAWRVEVTPRGEARDDRFLVVMFPSLAGQAPVRRSARLLEEGGRVGAEIAGVGREPRRWWFDETGAWR